MVCCQFFLLKINRLFLIRDANFKMNQKKKKTVEFSTSFCSGETENKINFDINNEKQWQFEQFQVKLLGKSILVSELCLLENNFLEKSQFCTSVGLHRHC
jgi:hypothetical protein